MRYCPTRALLRAALLSALAAPVPACAQTTPTSIQPTGQGQVSFSSSAIHELSGITYLGGNSFAVVSDTNGTMAVATILIDRTTGQITSASLGTPIAVAGGSDLEAIAYDPRDGSVLISDESGNTITRHSLADGSRLGSIAVPTIYNNARANFGFESLSLSPTDYTLWTVNEEALSIDGDISSTSEGTIVRLQQFDASGLPAVQYGYKTEPHAGGFAEARSGVSDLIALPSGQLIAMERELGAYLPSPFRIRLFAIDMTRAIDTSSIGSLANATSGLIEKELLYQVNAGLTNFEGVALGPMLSNGDYALVLVSDDGGGTGFNPQNLLALRLSGIAIDGDLTGDFVVDDDDLLVLLNNWGKSVATGDRLSGDLSGDGGVGIEDLDLVLAGWTAEQPPSVVVPEPAGVASIGGVAWTLLVRRW